MDKYIEEFEKAEYLGSRSIRLRAAALAGKLIKSAKKEAVEECIKLADDIELKYAHTEHNEWRAFKGFRNALADKIK